MKIFKSLLRGVLAAAVLGGVLLCGSKEVKATPDSPDTPIIKFESDNNPEPIPDHDTFKSEEPSGTVLASPTTEANKLGDLKVHATDAISTLNQAFLAKTLISPNAHTIVTENVYPRRDLTVTEDGSLQVLTWGNLPKNEAGPVYAVVYNQKDGAYVLNGVLDKNGVATFTGFKLRPASTITICK